MTTITTFCALCGTDTLHTVAYDTQEQADGTFVEIDVIKLTCPKSSPEVEHCIRMSGHVTKEEVQKILADYKADAQVITIKPEVLTDEEKLTELFN